MSADPMGLVRQSHMTEYALPIMVCDKLAADPEPVRIPPLIPPLGRWLGQRREEVVMTRLR